MFTRIQTRFFRCLKAIDQSIGPFHALVGPNASGKTTFLDVIGFLSDLMTNRGDVVTTTRSRSSNFEDLLWMREGRSFELAVEAEIPQSVFSLLRDDHQKFSHVRYEVEVGMDPVRNEIGLDRESLWLMEPEAVHPPKQRELFPQTSMEAPSLQSSSRKGRKAALSKKPGGNDNYYPEGKKSYAPSFKLGRTRSALASIPADNESFPVSTWFRETLERGVQALVLNSQLIRQPSPPGLGRRFRPDGSNLPWVIAELSRDQEKFENWQDHVRTALEDIRSIEVIERPEDRHRYLQIIYSNGAVVPSWLVSDGTLRLLALTILAYLPGVDETFLIEEPENGIHPLAIETVLQSLSSLYDSQVLVATHSPVAINLLQPSQVLCFAKDLSGATDIISGDHHPQLREWKRGEPDFGILFASGILS